MRHAFDADHIAAIDNTTRKFTAEGRRPVTVGFWFALGHSSMVIVLAVLVLLATRVASTLISDDSSTHRILGMAGAGVSGLFLYLIGVVNLVALVGIVRVFRELRRGRFDEQALETHLDGRGLVNRILGGLTRSIRRPGQMFPVASGMTLLDTADGVFMNYDIGFDDPVTGWIASLALDDVGYVVVGLFVVVWVGALAYWKLGRVEERWTPVATGPDRP